MSEKSQGKQTGSATTSDAGESDGMDTVLEHRKRQRMSGWNSELMGSLDNIQGKVAGMARDDKDTIGRLIGTLKMVENSTGAKFELEREELRLRREELEWQRTRFEQEQQEQEREREYEREKGEKERKAVEERERRADERMMAVIEALRNPK